MISCIRPYADADFDDLRELWKSARKEGYHTPFGCPEHLALILERPNHSSRQDLFLAVSPDGRLLGVADTTPELPIGRIVLDLYVRPEARRQGIAARLLSRALDRGRILGAQVIHVCVDAENTESQAFLSEHGFDGIRRTLVLVRRLDGLKIPQDVSEPLPLDRFPPGSEEILAEIQNRIFTGSWGFCPNSRQDIRFYLDLTGCRIQDITCLKDKDDIIGYIWIHPRQDAREDTERARIHMFGIEPEHRNRSWGKRLLSHILGELSRSGMGEVELSVDAYNWPAMRLYASLGFQIESQGLWYEKRFGPPDRNEIQP